MTTPTDIRLRFLHKKIYCRSTKGPVERLPQPNRLRKFCTDAGFLTTVGVGQYINKGHWRVLTIYRVSGLSWVHLAKKWKHIWPDRIDFEGTPKLGSYWKSQGNYGVEIRIESMNKDHSHSWVRISHGLNKLVTDLIDKEYDDNEQETFEMKSEEFVLKTNVSCRTQWQKE